MNISRYGEKGALSGALSQVRRELRVHGAGAYCFFQAEDGIRDYDVTGVQTCALPIWNEREEASGSERGLECLRGSKGADVDRHEVRFVLRSEDVV